MHTKSVQLSASQTGSGVTPESARPDDYYLLTQPATLSNMQNSFNLLAHPKSGALPFTGVVLSGEMDEGDRVGSLLALPHDFPPPKDGGIVSLTTEFWIPVINRLKSIPAPFCPRRRGTHKEYVFLLLEYKYVKNILERRGPYRDEHLKLAAESCVFAGPRSATKAGPIDGALLLFATDDKKVVDDFVKRDPYVINRLVTGVKIHDWTITAYGGPYFADSQNSTSTSGSDEQLSNPVSLPLTNASSPEYSPKESNRILQSASNRDFESETDSGTESEERLSSSEVEKLLPETDANKERIPAGDDKCHGRISSMSGFAKVDGAYRNKTWSWEVKSVNGRSLDVRARVPSSYSILEQTVTAAAANRFARGSISCFLDVKVDHFEQDKQLVINEDALIQAGTDILEAISNGPDMLYNQACFSWTELVRIPGMASWEEPKESEVERQELLAKMTASLHEALDQLLESRASEGDRLRAVLCRQVAELEALVGKAAEMAQQRLPRLKEKVQKQVSELLKTSSALDPGRLEQEVALLSIKLDVREEIDRLRSHIVAAKELLDKAQSSRESPNRPLAIGRQLDFLCQEFTRESSTICAKSNDIPLTQLGMQIKGISEQIKEQAANVQ